MNDLKDYANSLDGTKPFLDQVPAGYELDFIGPLTDANFRTMWGVDPKTSGGAVVQTRLPTIALKFAHLAHQSLIPTSRSGLVHKNR